MYSTFLGGIENELDCHIAVGSDGAAYIAGGTPSPNFPIVRALQPVMRGLSDIFVTKLDPGGAFVFSSFIGGGDTESATAVTVDGDGSVFMTGVTGSADFPRVGFVEDLGGPPEVSLTEADVFVLKLHASGAALVYSTDIGGDGVEAGHDIAVDAVGAAHVTGLTISLDFPTRNALQPTAPVFGEHAFVLKVSGDPACSPEVTSGLDILSIGYFHVPLTPLRFAVVLMHNRTGAPITGPLAYVMDDLRHAVFVGSRLSTRCFSTPADPLMLVDVGADRVLSPGEVVATGLWFYQTDADAISYLPRVLSGVPSR